MKLDQVRRIISGIRDWRADRWEELSVEDTVIINKVIRIIMKHERLSLPETDADASSRSSSERRQSG